MWVNGASRRYFAIHDVVTRGSAVQYVDPTRLYIRVDMRGKDTTLLSYRDSEGNFLVARSGESVNDGQPFITRWGHRCLRPPSEVSQSRSPINSVVIAVIHMDPFVVHRVAHSIIMTTSPTSSLRLRSRLPPFTTRRTLGCGAPLHLSLWLSIRSFH